MMARVGTACTRAAHGDLKAACSFTMSMSKLKIIFTEIKHDFMCDMLQVRAPASREKEVQWETEVQTSRHQVRALYTTRHTPHLERAQGGG